MKKKQLVELGFRNKREQQLAVEACSKSREFGLKGKSLREALRELRESPSGYIDHPLFAPLANVLLNPEGDTKADASPLSYIFREDLKYRSWGTDVDKQALRQMENACRLPISCHAALMPDAHVGYGLPIGGVLATKGAVIPYAVGVDIACRVKLSVFDIESKYILGHRDKLAKALEDHTRFGIGAKWRDKKQHDVLDRDWNITDVTRENKHVAWSQLGTSGSGNHFVEFGVFSVADQIDGLPAGEYVAMVSHSGSRGVGSRVANHYSKRAMERHRNLPKELKHLAWLPMDGDGEEYWAAMELMGHYASANHDLIHTDITKAIGAKVLLDIENHHNFAWKEQHHGDEYIVHRKGATPAGVGVRGFIPGTMVDPGFLVEGIGNADALNSCSHGAGRELSRTKAKNTTTFSELKKTLSKFGVTLLSAGLDESPHAYKDINKVMQEQQDLVKILGRFNPKIVKMAPAGEKPED